MKAKNMFRMTALCMGLVLALTGCGSAAPSSVSASTAESTATSAASSQAVSSQAVSVEAAQDLTGQTLMIYCGAGMQQPFEEIAAAFSEETGCEMNVTYANAAQLQTQITQSQEGAFFIAGSADEVKPVEECVVSSTDLVKHIPVLAVAEGNPKGITGIADLAREDVTTVTGDAEATPIGKIAKKAFQDFGVTDQVTLAATYHHRTSAGHCDCAGRGGCGHHLEGKLQHRRGGNLPDHRSGQVCENRPGGPAELCGR